MANGCRETLAIAREGQSNKGHAQDSSAQCRTHQTGTGVRRTRDCSDAQRRQQQDAGRGANTTAALPRLAAVAGIGGGHRHGQCKCHQSELPHYGDCNAVGGGRTAHRLQWPPETSRGKTKGDATHNTLRRSGVGRHLGMQRSGSRQQQRTGRKTAECGEQAMQEIQRVAPNKREGRGSCQQVADTRSAILCEPERTAHDELREQCPDVRCDHTTSAETPRPSHPLSTSSRGRSIRRQLSRPCRTTPPTLVRRGFAFRGPWSRRPANNRSSRATPRAPAGSLPKTVSSAASGARRAGPAPSAPARRPTLRLRVPWLR